MRHVLIVMPVVFAMLASGAHAASVSLFPTRDNTLFQDTNGDTSNGAGPMFSGRTNQNRLRRAVIAFDLQGVVETSAVVDSVSLVLHVSNASEQTLRTFELHRVSQDWGEGSSSTTGGTGTIATPGDATWLNTFFPSSFWTTPGGDFDSTASASKSVEGDGFYAWASAALTQDVRAWIAQPQDNHGWILVGDEITSGSARRFDSRENTTEANRPVLTIYFTTVATLKTSLGQMKARYR